MGLCAAGVGVGAGCAGLAFPCVGGATARLCTRCLCALYADVLPSHSAERRTGIINVGVTTFATSFSGDYANPVVIAGVPSHNGDEEIVVRVTSVDRTTKTIQFCAQPPHLHPRLAPLRRCRLALSAPCPVRPQTPTRRTIRARAPPAQPHSIWRKRLRG